MSGMLRHNGRVNDVAGGDASTGPAERLVAMFDQHFDAVFGFCVVRCSSRSLAEEVSADVFADAVRHVRANPDVELTLGWLMTVARRRIIDHWRRAERHRRRLERVAQEPDLFHPDDFASGPIDDERVLAALASLPERQRAALTARYIDEWSVSEVAEALDVSYQAMESLLARARRSFASAYRSTEGSP